MVEMPAQPSQYHTPDMWLALNDELAATKATLAVVMEERDTLKEQLVIANRAREKLEACFAKGKANAARGFDKSIVGSLPDHAWDVVLCYRFFNTIPQEVVVHILKYVDIVDIAAVARTCRRFHACVGSVMRSVLRRSGIDMDRALYQLASHGKVDGVKALL